MQCHLVIIGGTSILTDVFAGNRSPATMSFESNHILETLGDDRDLKVDKLCLLLENIHTEQQLMNQRLDWTTDTD